MRIPIVAGGILGGGSLAVLGHVEERWQLYVVYAVFALGFAGAGLVPVTTVVTRWYHVRRSVALSVASTGLSAGGILLTPLAKWLIDEHGLADVDADPRRRVGARHRAVRPVAGAAGPGRARVDARRRAGAATTCRRSSPPARRSTRPCAPASSSPSRSPTSSCSAPRSAGSSSSSSSSRSAPTTRTAALATILVAGTSVVARLVGGRIVARLPMTGFTVGLGAVQAVALAGLAFAETKLAHLRRDHPVRRHDRQHPDAPAAADRRALRRARLPAAVQPRPVPHRARHGRRAAAARLAVRQRRRLPHVVHRRRGAARWPAPSCWRPAGPATDAASRERRHPNVRRVVDAAADGRPGRSRPVRFPDGTKTAADAAAAIGVDVGQIVKSLIFAVDGDVVRRLRQRGQPARRGQAGRGGRRRVGARASTPTPCAR